MEVSHMLEELKLGISRDPTYQGEMVCGMDLTTNWYDITSSFHKL